MIGLKQPRDQDNLNTVMVTSLVPVGRSGRAGYRAPVGGRKCLVLDEQERYPPSLKRLCKNRWVKVNRVGNVSGGAIGARRTRGVARCDRLRCTLSAVVIRNELFESNLLTRLAPGPSYLGWRIRCRNTSFWISLIACFTCWPSLGPVS